MNYKELLIFLRESQRIDEKDLKQKEIAEKMGISAALYNIYENQNKIFPRKHLNALSKTFNISIDYFFGLTNKKNYSNAKDINSKLSSLRLKEFRKEQKISQKLLAEFLNTAQSVISDYENGKYLIATPFLYTICKKYHISADYLLGKTDEPKYLN